MSLEPCKDHYCCTVTHEIKLMKKDCGTLYCDGTYEYEVWGPAVHNPW